MIRNEYSFINTVSMKEKSYTKKLNGERFFAPDSPQFGKYSYMHFQNPGPLSPDYVKPVSPVKKFLKDLFIAIFRKTK